MLVLREEDGSDTSTGEEDHGRPSADFHHPISRAEDGSDTSSGEDDPASPEDLGAWEATGAGYSFRPPAATTTSVLEPVWAQSARQTQELDTLCFPQQRSRAVGMTYRTDPGPAGKGVIRHLRHQANELVLGEYLATPDSALGEEDWRALKKKYDQRCAGEREHPSPTRAASPKKKAHDLTWGLSIPKVEDAIDFDEVSDRKMNPSLALTTAQLFKIALVFHLVGTPQQIANGVALMDEATFLKLCREYPLSEDYPEARNVTSWAGFINILKDYPEARNVTSWAGFINILKPAVWHTGVINVLKDVSTSSIQQAHVRGEMELDHSAGSKLTGLFVFMGLPDAEDASVDRRWLRDRVHDFSLFKMDERLSGVRHPLSTFLPEGNVPWAHGLLLRNDIQGCTRRRRKQLKGSSCVRLRNPGLQLQRETCLRCT
ncbi:hypothetical protein T484DRAFT_1895436, partial [Baffinella frigidus]